MKPFVLLPLLCASPLLFAQSYVNVGMGFLDFTLQEPIYATDGTALTSNDTHTPSQVVYGHRSGNRILEIGYRVFRTTASQSLQSNASIPALPNNAPGGLVPNEYDKTGQSELRAQQWSVKLLYGFNPSQHLAIKAGIGALHSSYNLESNNTQTWQDSTNSPNTAYREHKHEKFKQEQWGWLATVGFDYAIWPAFNDGLTLGVDVTYSEDEYATILMPMVNVGWRF